MKWFEELHLTRRPLEQIGLAFVVREVFGNECRLDRMDADVTLGPGWMAIATELKRAGALRMEIDGRMVSMTVVASGDRKREMMKNYKRKARRILKGSKK